MRTEYVRASNIFLGRCCLLERGGRVTKHQNIVIVWRSRRKTYANYAYQVKGLEAHTRSSDLAARLIIEYEDDNPLHVETQKDFDVVSNRDTDAFCQGIS